MAAVESCHIAMSKVADAVYSDSFLYVEIIVQTPKELGQTPSRSCLAVNLPIKEG